MTTTAQLRVGNLMTVDPVTITPDAPAAEAERLLKTYRISGLPVTDGAAVIGVLSQSDLLVARSSALISGNWERLRVRHLMSTPATVVHAAASLRHAAQLMLDHHIHRLVVVDEDDQPIGVITPLDLLRTMIDDPGAV